MRNAKVLQMTIHAMFIGIMALMTFIPQIGFISITPVVSFTLLHLPVLIGALLFGWKVGLTYGMFFGLFSFIRAVTSPVSYIDFYFADPLVSILPRALFGLISGLAFDFIKLIKKNWLNKLVISGSAAVLTVIHSIVVLLVLGLIYAPAIEGETNFIGSGIATYWALMGLILVTNGVFEALIAAIILPVLALAIARYPRFQLIVNAFKKEKQDEKAI